MSSPRSVAPPTHLMKESSGVRRHVKYQKAFEIDFQVCDPAGQVFFPRYFDMAFQTMSSWMQEVLGINHGQLVANAKIGTATHSIGPTNFLSPAPLGRTLNIILRVMKIGGSSLTFHYEFRLDDQTVVAIIGEHVVVFVSQNPIHPRFNKSIDIPRDYRTKIERWMKKQPEQD